MCVCDQDIFASRRSCVKGKTCAMEFVCDERGFHPARGIHQRLAEIRHPSCCIFHADLWDSCSRKRTAQCTSFHAPVDRQETTKITHANLKTRRPELCPSLNCDESRSMPGMS